MKKLSLISKKIVSERLILTSYDFVFSDKKEIITDKEPCDLYQHRFGFYGIEDIIKIKNLVMNYYESQLTVSDSLQTPLLRISYSIRYEGEDNLGYFSHLKTGSYLTTEDSDLLFYLFLSK